jgi:hypothetical protein
MLKFYYSQSILFCPRLSHENRIPIAPPNICGDVYGGKSRLVGFDYNKETDIAVLKRMLCSVKAVLPPDYYYW